MCWCRMLSRYNASRLPQPLQAKSDVLSDVVQLLVCHYQQHDNSAVKN